MVDQVVYLSRSGFAVRTQLQFRLLNLSFTFEMITTDPIVEHTNEAAGHNDVGDISNAQRHNDLCFEDGNTVLYARPTLFCVHRSILHRESAVFKDMFSLPQPSSYEQYEGHPLVVLHDSGDEITLFLSVLFDPK